MITLKELTWSNAFSYADNNSIKLNENSLTQLVGKNGSGKTSIPLILEEVLYGKNIKNIKKQDISNRHTGNSGYSITLIFEKDNTEYKVELIRKTSIKLSLYENGQDISSHTSANTYKQISEILGIPDFKIFTQLIYQSSTGSLEFLTATDTNRKKFLISLLQLEKYVKLHEFFKAEARNTSLGVSSLEGKIEANTKWLNKHKETDFTKKELVPVPEDISKDIADKLAEVKANLSNIRSINAKIRDNNHYREELKNFDTSLLMKHIPQIDIKEYENLASELSGKRAKKLEPTNLLRKLDGLDNKCPTCLQDIEESYVSKLTNEAKNLINSLDSEIEILGHKRKEMDSIIAEIEEKERITRKFEELNRSYDPGLSSELLQSEDLDKEAKKLDDLLTSNRNAIRSAEKSNAEITKYNAELEVIEKQLEGFEKELYKLQKEYSIKKHEHDNLEMLKRIFSTNGLVSYKIESSVKELEKTINSYLSEFSHFQVFFKLDKDKLNIKVMDNTGQETSIESLSAGELGRVNIATVLAIRSIMSSLTSTKINFLFLDEIVGVLDAEGRERLTEILLKEGLNTFMVSHEYEHPLVPKLYIQKENNISRIENG